LYQQRLCLDHAEKL